MDAAFVLAVAATLAFAFTNGFHDAANAIATLVATRLLTLARRSPWPWSAPSCLASGRQPRRCRRVIWYLLAGWLDELGDHIRGGPIG